MRLLKSFLRYPARYHGIGNFHKFEKIDFEVFALIRIILMEQCDRKKYNRVNQWTDCIIDKIFKNIEIVKFITTALKSILKLVKLQSLVAKSCKM